MTHEGSVMAQVRRLANTPRKIADLITGAEWRKWSRVVMNHELEALARGLQPASLSCLEVSGDRWESYGFKAYKRTRYPEFDVCTDTPVGTPYDIPIADQLYVVWELARKPAQSR